MGTIFLVKFEPNSTTELYRYKLGNFKRIQYNINTPVSPMPLPEEDSADNILIKIEGNSSDFTLSWIINDNGGVNLEEVVPVATSTVKEQIQFFRELFKPQSIEDSFQLILRLDNADVTQDIVFNGTFSQFGFMMADPELLTFKATCKFLEGSVALGFEVDVSSEPLNLVVDSPSTGTIDADWDVPTDNGTSAITDYRIYYRILYSGEDFATSDVGSTATFKNDISGVTVLSNDVFEVHVRALTALGFGKPSRTKHVTVQA
jgi:hypothetical protein